MMGINGPGMKPIRVSIVLLITALPRLECSPRLVQ